MSKKTPFIRKILSALLLLTVALVPLVGLCLALETPPFPLARSLIIFQAIILTIRCLIRARDETAREFKPSRSGTTLAMVMIGLSILVGFGPELSNYFLADDFIHLCHSRSFSEAMTYFSFGTKKFIRPLQGFLWWMDQKIWNLSPEGYHLTNIIIHIINTGLLWRLARHWLEEPGALLSAVLFSLYPLHYGTVSWISGGHNDLLCATGFLLSALGTVRLARNQGGFVIALSGLILALGSKETVFLLPFLCLVIGLLMSRGSLTTSLKRWLWISVLVVVIWGILRVKILSGMGGYATPSGTPLSLTAPGPWIAAAFTRVPELLIFPLAPPLPPAEVWLRRVLLLSFSLLLVLMAQPRVRAIPLLVGFAWIVFSIAPALPVIAIAGKSTFVVARFFYLPWMGLALAIGAALHPWPRKATVVAGFLILAASLSGLRHNQSLLRYASDQAKHFTEALLNLPTLTPSTSAHNLVFNVPAYSGDVLMLNASGDDLLSALLPEKKNLARLTLEMTGFPESQLVPRLSLEEYDAFYQWEKERGRLKEVTMEVKQILARQREIEQGPSLSPLIIFDHEHAEVIPGTHNLMPLGIGRWQVNGEDPWLVFPGIRVSPWAVSSIELTLSVTPLRFLGYQYPLSKVYWTSTFSPHYSEDKSLPFLLQADGRPHTYTLLVRTNLSWLLSGIITRLRVDPVEYPAEVHLLRILLKPVSSP